MTDKQMLQALINAGERMRAAQKGFFTTNDKILKRDFLIQSKQLEKEFDTALLNIKQFVS